MSDAIKLDENIVTTVVMSLEAVVAYMQSVLPGISFIYDENLGYETGVTELRAANNLRDEFSNKLPAFFFKRSVVRPSPNGQGRRSVTNMVVDKSVAGVKTYGSLYGQYDLDFMFVTTRLSEMENLEISWMTENGIPKDKSVTVTIPGLGDFDYFMNFNLLSDKTIQNAGNYYKALTGSMIVTGWYFAFQGTASLVQQINTTFQTFSGQVLGTDVAQYEQPENTDTIVPTN
jgi:hypothetical protein